MPDFSQKTIGNACIFFDASVFLQADPQIFDHQHWQQRGELVGSAQGRGTTYFFAHERKEYVLRKYLRGGLIGKILHDQYFYTGLDNTRAVQELRLLQKMIELNLPVAKPVAAMVRRWGPIYHANLITERIPQAQDLFDLLCNGNLTSDIWHKVGQTIALFHRKQVFHHDLNIHNIMLDKQGKLWLIDFDKCRVRPGQDWKLTNLARLQRSLEKEKTKIENFSYKPDNWQSLLQGYRQHE